MFYTYAHSSPDGKIFYIGKGVGDRAFSFSDRSHDWKRAVKDNKGVSVDILAYWNTEDEAFDHEQLLIDCFSDMKYKLVNKTKGGKGAYGYICSEEKKKSLRDKLTGFVHEKIACPKCNTVGGATTMKRWHFDNCKGVNPYKARVSVNGNRIYLGKYSTKELANNAVSNYLKENNI